MPTRGPLLTDTELSIQSAHFCCLVPTVSYLFQVFHSYIRTVAKMRGDKRPGRNIQLVLFCYSNLGWEIVGNFLHCFQWEPTSSILRKGGYECALWTVKQYTNITFLFLLLLTPYCPPSPLFKVVPFSWEYCLSLASTICTSESAYSKSLLSCRGNGSFLFIMKVFCFFSFGLIWLCKESYQQTRRIPSKRNLTFLTQHVLSFLINVQKSSTKMLSLVPPWLKIYQDSSQSSIKLNKFLSSQTLLFCRSKYSGRAEASFFPELHILWRRDPKWHFNYQKYLKLLLYYKWTES